MRPEVASSSTAARGRDAEMLAAGANVERAGLNELRWVRLP